MSRSARQHEARNPAPVSHKKRILVRHLHCALYCTCSTLHNLTDILLSCASAVPISSELILRCLHYMTWAGVHRGRRSHSRQPTQQHDDGECDGSARRYATSRRAHPSEQPKSKHAVPKQAGPRIFLSVATCIECRELPTRSVLKVAKRLTLRGCACAQLARRRRARRPDARKRPFRRPNLYMGCRVEYVCVINDLD
jgi:hypothetical protein